MISASRKLILLQWENNNTYYKNEKNHHTCKVMVSCFWDYVLTRYHFICLHLGEVSTIHGSTTPCHPIHRGSQCPMITNSGGPRMCGSPSRYKVSVLCLQLSKWGRGVLTAQKPTLSDGTRIYFKYRKATAFEETQMTKEVLLFSYCYDFPTLTHHLHWKDDLLISKKVAESVDRMYLYQKTKQKY